MLITLALGLASVGFFNWSNDYSTEIPVDLPKLESSSPIFIFPRESGVMPRSGGDDGCGGKNYNKKIKNIKRNRK